MNTVINPKEDLTKLIENLKIAAEKQRSLGHSFLYSSHSVNLRWDKTIGVLEAVLAELENGTEVKIQEPEPVIEDIIKTVEPTNKDRAKREK